MKPLPACGKAAAMNVLVLCTGNSARSILLEAILNRHSGGRIAAFSAGSRPAGRVHPAARRLLQAEGYDTDQLRSKSWDVFAGNGAPVMDAVITVCGSAAVENCPVWPGAPVRAHWGVEDPAAASEQDWPTAFRTAYEILERRAARLLREPLETLDTAALTGAMSRIGTTR